MTNSKMRTSISVHVRSVFKISNSQTEYCQNVLAKVSQIKAFELSWDASTQGFGYLVKSQTSGKVSLFGEFLVVLCIAHAVFIIVCLPSPHHDPHPYPTATTTKKTTNDKTLLEKPTLLLYLLLGNLSNIHVCFAHFLNILLKNYTCLYMGWCFGSFYYWVLLACFQQAAMLPKVGIPKSEIHKE